MPPDLALLSTLIGSNYPCLKHIVMVPKVFEPLQFYCSSCKNFLYITACSSYLLSLFTVSLPNTCTQTIPGIFLETHNHDHFQEFEPLQPCKISAIYTEVALHFLIHVYLVSLLSHLSYISLAEFTNGFSTLIFNTQRHLEN